MASDPQYPNEAAHAHAQTLKGPTPAKDRQRETMYRSHVAGQVHSRTECERLREALRDVQVLIGEPYGDLIKQARDSTAAQLRIERALLKGTP